MAEKEVLNSEEAAEFLGFSAFTIREYAKKGIVPAKKIGKEWRFYKPELVAWLTGKGNQQQQRSEAQPYRRQRSHKVGKS